MRGTHIDHSPTAEIIKGNGELLPVSKMPCDGVFPTATTKYEKRDLTLNIPSGIRTLACSYQAKPWNDSPTEFLCEID